MQKVHMYLCLQQILHRNPLHEERKRRLEEHPSLLVLKDSHALMTRYSYYYNLLIQYFFLSAFSTHYILLILRSLKIPWGQGTSLFLSGAEKATFLPCSLGMGVHAYRNHHNLRWQLSKCITRSYIKHANELIHIGNFVFSTLRVIRSRIRLNKTN